MADDQFVWSVKNGELTTVKEFVEKVRKSALKHNFTEVHHSSDSLSVLFQTNFWGPDQTIFVYFLNFSV